LAGAPIGRLDAARALESGTIPAFRDAGGAAHVPTVRAGTRRARICHFRSWARRPADPAPHPNDTL